MFSEKKYTFIFRAQLPPAYVCVCARTCAVSLVVCISMDHSLPGSSVRGILQTRILEWVAMPCSGIVPPQGSSPHLSCLLHWQTGSLPLVPPGKPHHCQDNVVMWIWDRKTYTLQLPMSSLGQIFGVFESQFY